MGYPPGEHFFKLILSNKTVYVCIFHPQSYSMNNQFSEGERDPDELFFSVFGNFIWSFNPLYLSTFHQVNLLCLESKTLYCFIKSILLEINNIEKQILSWAAEIKWWHFLLETLGVQALYF